MFRGIAYWTYYFCSKNKFLQKDRMVIPVALMWGSLPLFMLPHLYMPYCICYNYTLSNQIIINLKN